MGRIGKWIGAILLAGLVLLPLLGREQKMKSDKITVVEEMRALNRLWQNYFRNIQEYDTTNDASSDTLLWSKEKTDAEVVVLLRQMLSKRDVLRMVGGADLVRQSRVERWRFALNEDESQYVNAIIFANAISNVAKPAKQLLEEELEIALKKGYYPEALIVLRAIYPVEKYGEYRPRFGNHPEGSLIDLLLLQEEHRTTLLPIEKKILPEKATEADREWLRLMPSLEKRGRAIVSMLKGTKYESKSKNIFDSCFGSKRVQLSTEELNTATGVLRVKLFGLFSSETLLKRGSTKIASVPSGIVRMEVEDQLPKPGTYTYSVDREQDEYGGFSTYLRYDKIYLTAGEVEGNKVQIRVLNRATASPVAGVVAVGEGQVVRSDHDGVMMFPMKSRGYMVKVEDSRLAEPYSTYVPQLPVQIKEERSTITEANFYTDRPIYRRGQEVKVGIVVSELGAKQERTLPDYPLHLTLKAMRGAEEVTLSKVSLKTNAQGVVETSFTLPKEENLSNFRIESKIGNEYIAVEDYKLSYLTIQLDSIPKGYVMGHPLVVMGKTTDLNGYPTSAKVLLEYENSRRVEVTSGADGLFSITTPKVEEHGFGIRLTASDALGNTASTFKYISTEETDMPLNAYALLTGEQQNKERFTLSTKGQPYTKRWLGNLSNRHIYAELINSQDTITLGELPIEGEQEFSLPQLPSGSYKVRLYTTDGYGQLQERETEPIYFYGPKDTKLVGKHLLWAVRLESGELLYGSSFDLPLFYALEQEGVVKEQRVLQAKAGQLQRLSLPKEASGMVTLFALRNMEEATERIMLGTKEGNSEQARFEGLKFEEKFLPGADFQKSIRVLDKAGKPLAHAPVIATVFDKAVVDAAGGSAFWSLISYPQLMLRSAVQPQAMYAKEEVLAEDSFTIGYAQAGGANMEAPLRTNFVETAYFSALLVTDEQGEVKLSFKMPDTQTQYLTKLFAFSTDLKVQVMDETTFEVSTPLSIELSTPRFLVWGDVLEGEALLRNTSDQSLTAQYAISSGGKTLSEGTVEVPANATTAVPFTTQAPEGEVLKLQGRVVAGAASDGIERVIPLRSNLSTYIVAQPISAYKQSEVSLTLPKMELSNSPLMLQLYLDPVQLLLSKLALAHRDVNFKELGLFGAVHYYAVYHRLQSYLADHPDFAKELKKSAGLLEQVERKPSTRMDRMADPKCLAAFYKFITDEAELQKRLSAMEQTLLTHAMESGGFYYSSFFREASPWLTHYVLSSLGGLDIKNPKLQQKLELSLTFLEQELRKERSYYRDYVGYALIAHDYGRKLPDFGKPMKQQVEWLQKNYQSTNNSAMLRYATYSRIYESKSQYAEVRRFIQDRSGYTFDDDEQLSLMMFLQKDEQKVSEEVIKFALQVKQNTLWYDRGILDVAELILDKVTPTRIASDAMLQVGGQSYHLTPEERMTGTISMEYPAKADQLTITWSGVESDYVFGGLSYLVTEPSAKATPTGDKLKVEKQIYVRQVDSEGKQTFALADQVKKGDKLIVRYLIEAEQDLSLVTLVDPRPATSEFGYQFEGYGRGDRFWWHYSRRDAEDRLYIDWLPRGRHLIEIEAIASQSGHFTYGPAQIQSYYAPEYAGNSSGGTLQIGD